MFVSVIMSDEWGVDESPVVVAPEVQDIKLFGKWSTDDVQVSDISLTVSVTFLTRRSKSIYSGFVPQVSIPNTIKTLHCV